MMGSVSKWLLLATASLSLMGCNYVLGVSGTPDPAIVDSFKLSPGGVPDFTRFGSSVDIEGDRLVVGATGSDGQFGIAYVFARSGDIWEPEAFLVPSDASRGNSFGVSVALSGDRIIVGAAGTDDGASANAGAAFIFARDGNGTWSEQAHLTADDAGPDKLFGLAVSIDGTTALVGSPGTGATSFAGNAFFFEEAGGVWSPSGVFSITDGSAGDAFGRSVAIDGSFAVVGAPNVDVNGTSAGATFAFAKSGSQWTSDGTLLAGPKAGQDTFDGDRFGSSVALEGDRMIIGAPGADLPDGGILAGGAGAAHVFVRQGSGWSIEDVLRPDSVSLGAFEGFGAEVAIYDKIALVGAPGANASNLEEEIGGGAVYAFGRNDSSWFPEAKMILDDTKEGDDLGQHAIALYEDEAVFGLRFDSEAGAETGSATWLRLGFAAP